MRSITKAAVIGAGVMGAGIAAHLANAGIRVVLLDIVDEELKKGLSPAGHEARSRIAVEARERLARQRPPFSIAAERRAGCPGKPGRRLRANRRCRLDN